MSEEEGGRGREKKKPGCYELLCSEEQSEIGEQYIKDHGSLYGNDQLPDKVQEGFEWAIIIISAFHFLVAVGILIFGIYTYCLREEIRHSSQHLSNDAVIYQLSLVPNYLIGIGCIVIVFSLLGVAGIMRHYVPLMYLYIAFLLAYSFCQFVCAILALTMSSRIDGAIHSYFSGKGIMSYRDDIDLQNLIDFLQINFECCGGSDKNGHLDWNKNIYFECSATNPSFERCGVPFSCCKGDRSSARFFPDVPNSFCGYRAQLSGQKTGANGTFIYTGGCVKAVFTSISTYGGYIVAAIFGLVIVPIALEILLVLLIRDVREERRGYDLWVEEEEKQKRNRQQPTTVSSSDINTDI